jgi:hypothetical protein
MEDQLRELARRDAKAIKAGVATACLAIVVGAVSLFSPAVVGVVAAAAGIFVQLNAIVAWLAGPRMMEERRLVLAPGVAAGLAVALGTYGAFGEVVAIIASMPTAALVTILLGMTLAGRRV